MLTRRTSQAAVPVPAQEIASTEQSPETNSDPIGTISTSGEVARRLHPRQLRSPDQPLRAPRTSAPNADVGASRTRSERHVIARRQGQLPFDAQTVNTASPSTESSWTAIVCPAAAPGMYSLVGPKTTAPCTDAVFVRGNSIRSESRPAVAPESSSDRQRDRVYARPAVGERVLHRDAVGPGCELDALGPSPPGG
jgi:hypothetical protein